MKLVKFECNTCGTRFYEDLEEVEVTAIKCPNTKCGSKNIRKVPEDNTKWK